MANNAFDFNQAPSGKSRQFGALGLIGKALGVGKSAGGKSGVSAKDQSALMRQKAAHDIDNQIVGHILGQTAAGNKQAHEKSMAKLGHKNSQVAADAAHQRDIAKMNTSQQIQHETIDYTSRALQSHAGGRQMKSVSLPGGSASFIQPEKATEENG